MSFIFLPQDRNQLDSNLIIIFFLDLNIFNNRSGKRFENRQEYVGDCVTNLVTEAGHNGSC